MPFFSSFPTFKAAVLLPSTLGFFLILSGLLHGQEYELVWSDEFTDGLSEDWTYDIGGHGWGNNELQYYTDSNTSVSDGILKITVKKEQIGANKYTSSRIKTKDAQAWTYGKIEARIKLSKVQGNFPAFWLLGSTFNGTNWPECGEIDIMEQINTEDIIHSNVHYDNFGYASNSKSISNNVTEFHTYAIDWDEQAIRFLLDGKQYHYINISNSANGTDEFHRDHFILLNYAMGANWPGFDVNESALPATMEVDYVRVYQKNTGTFSADDEAIPSNIFVSETYPNPFNPSTNIQISLPQSHPVNIEIFNVLGQSIEAGTQFLHAGQNLIPIDGSGWNNGIYFIIVRIGNETFTRKTILIK